MKLSVYGRVKRAGVKSAGAKRAGFERTGVKCGFNWTSNSDIIRDFVRRRGSA